MSKFTKTLLKQKDTYNGHFQQTITGMSVKSAIKLCKELEKETQDKYMFYVQVFTDKSWTIYQAGYFSDRVGQAQDRMILSNDNS
jgi:hypothetical protein